MPSVVDYLDPVTLRSISDLEIVARLVVEGFISGQHKSPFKGFSIEFAQHRPYVRGDEVKHIDWRVFGRSDRYFIKQYEEETNLRCHLLLDASGSMAYSSHGADKLTYAKHLAAAISYLTITQTDSAGAVTFDTQIRSMVPPRSTRQHLQRIIELLSAAKPEGDTGLANVLHQLANRIRGRGLVIVMSDLFDDADAVLTALSHFRHKRHELIVFQIVDPKEADFPFDQWIQFESLETAGQKLLVDAARYRQEYRRQYTSHMERIRDGCHKRRIDFVELNTATRFDVALTQYMQYRMKVGI
jgi:uncharacterized protein (DUF58 family)